MRGSLALSASDDGRNRRERLIRNAVRLKTMLQPSLNLGHTESWIIPAIYGDEKLTFPLTSYLYRAGLVGSPMQYPAVPKDQARIRLFVTSEHTEQDLEAARQVLVEAANQFNFRRVK